MRQHWCWQNNNNADLNEIENIALYSASKNIYWDDNPSTQAPLLSSKEGSNTINNWDSFKSVEVTGRAVQLCHKETTQRYHNSLLSILYRWNSKIRASKNKKSIKVKSKHRKYHRTTKSIKISKKLDSPKARIASS